MLVLSLCGNDQEFFFRGEVASPAFLRLFQGQGINTCMTVEEVVRNYIRETVKPLTPDQARHKALKGNVDRGEVGAANGTRSTEAAS